MIYAVIDDGPHQYMVEEGDLIRVHQRDDEVGAEVEFDNVLLFQAGDELRIGQPSVDGAKVRAEIVDHPSVKTYIQKFRRRKTYRRLRGHRQHFTRVRILELMLAGWQRPEPEEAEDQYDEENDQDEDEEEENEVDNDKDED